MSGLLSRAPSQPAIRLALAGALLLIVQSLLLLLAHGIEPNVRLLLWVVTPIAVIAELLALIGFPEPPAGPWKHRHAR